MLYNNSQGQFTTTGHRGYLRISNYFYLPIGVKLQYSPNNWLIQSQLQFNYLLYGL